MKQNNSLAEIIQFIKEEDSFLLTSHIGPDGDNLGSTLALKLILEQIGKEVQVVLADTIPDCFSFLPAIDQIVEYSPALDFDYDVVCILDASNQDRVGAVAELIAGQPVINLDHHQDNTYFGDYNLVQEVAATAEIVYQLVTAMSQVNLTPALAQALATGLLTDTGSFRYANTTAQTHQIMADLLKYEVDTSYIARKVFGTNSYESLKLRGAVLQNLQTDQTGQIAWLKVDQELLEETGATWDDTEGLVGYPRSLAGAEVGVLFKEQAPEEIKVSLRSNTFLPVNQVAHQFSGGGHPRAAGCLLEVSLEEAETKVITALQEALAI
ncbi:DHH family phosphoesterase [Halanaerobaculum tunisiense]